jgi:cytochrome c556
MRIASKTAVAGAAIAALVSLLPAVAHEQATGVVKERMDAMESMAKAMKAINQRIKANRDLASVKADAQAIQEAAAKIPALFPPGSNQHPSEAKAVIWKTWSDFEAKARVLAVESDKLAKIGSADAKPLAAQVRAVSQACGGCHEIYRAKSMKHEAM